MAKISAVNKIHRVLPGKDSTMSKTQNLQDHMLNALRREKQLITVFLMNGFQMKGSVTGFDDFTVILETEGKQQMIYKHAISTLIPQRAVSLAEGNNT